MKKKQSEKLRLIAFLLSFFFGGLGLHRFYVGKTGTGIVQLLLTLSIIGAIISLIWNLIDWIMITSGQFTDKDGLPIIKWTE